MPFGGGVVSSRTSSKRQPDTIPIVCAFRRQQDLDPAKVAAARLDLFRRVFAYATRPGMTDAQRNAASRAQFEIQDMLARVQREVAKTGRGWTWHLLAVLDWDSRDIEANEKQRPRLLVAAAVPIDHRALDRKWKRDFDVLRRALSAYEASLPLLAESARNCFAGTPVRFPDDAHRGLRVLKCALEWHAARSATWSRVRSMHGKVRRYDHVRAAAMRMLIHLHDLAGRNEKARLADFIVATNERCSPRPCRRFAGAGDGAGAHTNVRKILSRARL
jgi:hypothetical protein